jgi:threonine dehydrogenase-like Zn-dependent dehydrogenase
VLVTGAGPIGLLAALICVQHGLDVHVLDRVTAGPKPDIVAALGATYHASAVADIGFAPDVIMECTGAGAVISDSIQHVGSGGIVCLTGVGAGGSAGKVPTADAAAAAVLKNNVIVGSVNANKRHWYKGSQALARADRSWLSRLITRREKPGNVESALLRKADDIKVVIQFSAA